MVHSFMAEIEKYDPPQGRLHLARQNGDFVGVGCLKALEGELGETKMISTILCQKSGFANRFDVRISGQINLDLQVFRIHIVSRK